MTEFLWWTLSALLAALFVGANIANLSLLLRRDPPRSGRPASPILFAGGIVGALALAVAPYEPLNDYFWLPLLVDLGTGPYLLVLAVVLSYQGLRSGAWLRQLPFVPYLIKPAVVLPPVPYPKERAIVGCLLGTAVGDAIGLAQEGLSRQRQERIFPRLDGYRLLFGKGLCSDDTEHTCLLAQSLIETGNEQREVGKDEGEDEGKGEQKFIANFAWRLRFWLLGLPAGIGMATLKAILKLWLGFSGRHSGIRSAGNAPAMRSALLGVCYGDDEARMTRFNRAATRITHTDPEAEQGALAVALAAHLAATSEHDIAPADYLRALQNLIGETASFSVLLREVIASITRGEDAARYAVSIGCSNGVSGYVCHTVPVALHVWLTHQQDYRGAVLGVVRLGGDTDTVAAIVGAIVGTRVGKDGIPAEWRRDLWEWPRTLCWIEQLGVTLARHQAEGTIGGALPLSLIKLLLRNVFFLVLVLLHGFRRLLPPY